MRIGRLFCGFLPALCAALLAGCNCYNCVCSNDTSIQIESTIFDFEGDCAIACGASGVDDITECEDLRTGNPGSLVPSAE